MQTITCPRCQTQMTVSDNFAGRLIPCAYCSTPMTVPAARVDALSQMAGAAAQTRYRIRLRPGRGRGLWAAALGAAAMIVLAIVLLVVMQSKLNSPNHTGPRAADEQGRAAGQAPAGAGGYQDQADAPITADSADRLNEARQKAQRILAGRLDNVLATRDLDDDIDLANDLVDEAGRIQTGQPLVAAILFARAAQLMAPMRGKYDAARANIRAAIGLARSVGGDVEAGVYEIGQALRALANSPDAKDRPPDNIADPTFFGVK